LKRFWSFQGNLTFSEVSLECADLHEISESPVIIGV
jgi:hypothetical protein